MTSETGRRFGQAIAAALEAQHQRGINPDVRGQVIAMRLEGRRPVDICRELRLTKGQEAGIFRREWTFKQTS